MAWTLWTYNATILRIIDGDTVDVEVDLGFEISHQIRLRLAHINAPELHAPDPAPGLRAKAYIQTLLPEGTAVILVTEKDRTEKFGRYLANIKILETNAIIDVNQSMIASGNAVAYEGGAR